MCAHPHPSRAGEPTEATARVRHRGTGREGRVIHDPPPAWAGDVRVLFDGETRSSSVPVRAVDYLDAVPGRSPSRRL